MRKYSLNCMESCLDKTISIRNIRRKKLAGFGSVALCLCLLWITQHLSKTFHTVNHMLSAPGISEKKRIVDWKTRNNRTWVNIPVRVQSHWQVLLYGKFHATKNKFSKPSLTISTMPRVHLSTPHAVNEQTTLKGRQHRR